MRDDLQRRFLALALPNVASNLLVPLSGLVDIAMLGHFGGVDDLAGVALGTVLFNYFLWTFGFLRMGTTGLTAQAVGARDPQAAMDVCARGLALAWMVGALVVTLRVPLGDFGFGILEGSAGVEQSARAYYLARILGAPLALTSFVLHGTLLGFGRGREVLLLSTTSNLTNMALDYVLIAHMDMGAAGAGYATVAAHAAACCVGLPLVLQHAHSQHAHLRWSGARDLSGLAAFLKLGGGLMLRTAALLTAFALFTDFGAVLGDERLAANTLLLQAVTLAAFFIDGYAFSVESLAGRLYGAGEARPLGRLLRLAVGWGLGTGALFALLFSAFPEPLLHALTDHQALVSLATRDVMWLWPILLLGSMAYVLDGFFIGLSSGRVLSQMMMLSLVLGFLPPALYARSIGSSAWLWLSMATFMLARTLTLFAHVPATLRRAAQNSSS